MKILCKILGHKYKTTKVIKPFTVLELECTRCGKRFGYHRELKTVLPLTEDIRFAHDVMLGVKP